MNNPEDDSPDAVATLACIMGIPVERADCVARSIILAKVIDDGQCKRLAQMKERKSQHFSCRVGPPTTTKTAERAKVSYSLLRKLIGSNKWLHAPCMRIPILSAPSMLLSSTGLEFGHSSHVPVS